MAVGGVDEWVSVAVAAVVLCLAGILSSIKTPRARTSPFTSAISTRASAIDL